MKLTIKIGGSVLVDEDSYRLEAERLKQVVQNYKPPKLYVVVSAKKGETDRLIREISNPDDEELLKKALKGEYVASHILHKYNNPLFADRLL